MKLTIATLLLTMSSFTAAETLYQGEFEATSYWTRFEGSWSIQKNDDQYVITFGENFDAKKAPDLKVFLSKKAFTEINGKNASGPDAVMIAPLTTYKGRVTMVIPDGIDPSAYRSIIVHCEAYAKLWGGAPLF